MGVFDRRTRRKPLNGEWPRGYGTIRDLANITGFNLRTLYRWRALGVFVEERKYGPTIVLYKLKRAAKECEDYWWRQGGDGSRADRE